MPERACTGTNKSGQPCKAHPMAGQDVCVAHTDDETKASIGFGGIQPGGGRPKAPRAVDVLRERIEQDIEKWVKPFLDALDATRVVWVGTGEDAQAITVPDHAIRMRSSAEGFDRAYGKPKQVSEVSGPEGGPLKVVAIPTEQAWHQQVASVLNDVGALPGATNGNGTSPHQD